MGLDMWMYGIRDISNDDIPDGKTENWYNDRGYSVIDTNDYDEDELEELIGDLIPYCVERNVEYTLTDLKRIKKDYNIPEEAYLDMWGGNLLGFSWKVEENEKNDNEYVSYLEPYRGKNNAVIEIDDIRKYDIKEVHKSFINKKDELAYWRKYYDLQDLIYKNVMEKLRTADIMK